jgi:hypothetical protein
MGLRTRNARGEPPRADGQIVLASAEACARHLGRKQQWDKWARECSEIELAACIAVALALSPAVRAASGMGR